MANVSKAKKSKGGMSDNEWRKMMDKPNPNAVSKMKHTPLWTVIFGYVGNIEPGNETLIEETDAIGPFQTIFDANQWCVDNDLSKRKGYQWHEIVELVSPSDYEFVQ